VSLRVEEGMEFVGKYIRLLVETAQYSVPNIAIPVHKLMVFIAINNNYIKSPYAPGKSTVM